MPDIKITELVPQETIDELKNLDREMQNVVESYTNTARELAKGLKLEVKVIGDIDKIDQLFIEKTKEMEQTTRKCNAVLEEKGRVIANTTNTISRHLMEQERVNKTEREAYTEFQRAKEMLEAYNGTYEQHMKDLVNVENKIKANKKAIEDNEKAFKSGSISLAQYNAEQVKLKTISMELKQEKATLNQTIRSEIKELQTADDSYIAQSQVLERLKKAYKDLSESEQTGSEQGRAMLEIIQNLDAHLKDSAADMGEFQRNVGNYAIAGQNGVVSTESLVAAMEQEARTLQEVIDQTKILEEGKRRLNPEDENYASTLERVNTQLAANRARLNDVSDIMNKQATSIAEAEEQNKRLNEALRNVDQTSDEASAQIEALNAKIEENNKIISSGQEAKASVKKDLKELVLEIANLSIEYQNLTEEEKNSAEGQALAQHIQELTERAGVLKDAISDTNQAISNAASDTRGFDQLGGSLQLAINGFGLATGAAEIFGISSGDLAEIQTKLQAAIAASNAMQAIQNTLQKQSAVMQGVNLAQTKLRTIAENLHTAAQGKGVIATKLLTVAQWAFNAAASANPIGLVVVAITAAIAAVYGLIKAFQAFFGNSEEAIKQYEAEGKAIDDLRDKHNKLIDTMKAQGATESELLKQTLDDYDLIAQRADKHLQDAKELYKEDSDEYQEALDAKKKADEDFEKAKEDSLNYLLKIIHDSEEEEKKQRLGTYEYKRQLIQAELQQQKALAATLLAQEKITRQVYENLVASLDKAAQLKIDAVNEDEKKNAEKKSSSVGGGRSRSSGSNAADDLKKATQAGEDAMLNLIEDSLARQERAENLSYARRRKELEDHLAKTSAKNVKMRTALQQQLEGLEAEHNQKIAKIWQDYDDRENNARKSVIDYRLKVAKEGSDEELALLMEQEEVRMAIELNNIKKNEREKKITREQAALMYEKEIEYHEQRVLDIQNEFNQKRIDMLQNETAKRTANINNEYLAEAVALKKKLNEDIMLAGNNQRKREEAERNFNRRMAEIGQVYTEQQINAEIEMLEKILQMEELSAEERYKIESELSAKKLELMEKVADFYKDILDNTTNNSKQSTKEWWDAMNWEERVAFILNSTAEVIDSITNLTSAFFDRQIQQIEQLMEANRDAGDKEQERISELVEKKVITEEEGEARKRAAEAQTARKEKELALQKAQLQKKQAVWDKANSIAQAAIATALAITQALPNIVLAAIAGAMGAAQIATIVATPIPQYAKGTDYHKGGFAIVGDGGRQEVVQYGGNVWLTPDTPTLVELPKGASVYPSVDDLKQNIFMLPTKPVGSSQQPHRIYDDKAMRKGVSEVSSLLRTMIRQQHRDAKAQQYAIFKSRI